jgi:hypothetical protein
MPNKKKKDNVGDFLRGFFGGTPAGKAPDTRQKQNEAYKKLLGK